MLSNIVTELREQVNTSSASPIIVKGYGRMSAETARNTSIKRLQTVLRQLEAGDATSWKNAHNILYGSGVLEEIFKAVIQHETNK